MRVLFAVTHIGFLRNFESTLALLAERGHTIHLVTDRRNVSDAIDGRPIVDRLTARFPGVFTIEAVQISKRHPWYACATVVREGLNYWRYLSPTFDASPKLRARGRQNAPAPVVALSDVPLVRSRAGVRVLTAVFRRLEMLIPVRAEVAAVFDRERPDVLLVTPLLYFGSQQVDYVRGARARGIPSVLGVGSWDHLTTKGLIHELPDRILVWNELQRGEAAALHGARPEQVTVTGAQAYDHWFAHRPSTTYSDWCARVGVPAHRPYLLYLCSSPFIAPHEVNFVRAWIAAIRGSGNPTLRTAGILVRPHPQNAAQWAAVDVSELGDVVIWPRAGANPIGLDARSEYYDSMHHAHAVVGINTSAMIESGILGRLVYSIRAAEFSGTQEGTLHFQHLTRGGLLRMADTLDEHVAQLGGSFASADADRARIRGFIELFVRPNGLDQPATPRVVDAVEQLAAQRCTPRTLPMAWKPAQLVVHGVLLAFVALPSSIARMVSADERDKARQRARKRVRSAWKASLKAVRRGLKRKRPSTPKTPAGRTDAPERAGREA